MRDLLPKNPTELYNHFICFTIIRHLYKVNNPLTHDITDLTQLPKPCSTIIQQLSKFSLQALNSNKLIFTLDEIKSACPDLTTSLGDINGFGLLQAVNHFGLHAERMTLNFIHFTIQEFLAAHYVSNLSPDEELKVIEANFWNSSHLNMFSIYISLTKGQRLSFQSFLSDGNEAIAIANKFLKDQLKCLYLYRHFNEAGDQKMCAAIEQAEIFARKEIIIQDTTLTASDMELISLFLTLSSNKKWVKLDLYNCNIQDKELNILYRGLCHSSNVTIEKLLLSHNGLTTQSASLISKLTVKYKVKVLEVDHNHTLGNNQQLYYMLTESSSVLEKLNMFSTGMSSKSAIALFDILKDNNKLKELYVGSNSITDDASTAITTALEKNYCLVTLNISNNVMSNETLNKIVQCLKDNNTLQHFHISDCVWDEDIKLLQEKFNKKRKNQGCHLKLQISTTNLKYRF